MKQETPCAWAPLKDKLDRAKDKLKNRTRHRRQRADQLRYRDEKIARLENEITELRLITDSQPFFNCHYPAQMMAIAIFIVLHGGALRCAAATTGFYAVLMGWKYTAPSFKTVSKWVERCGLHALGLTKSVTGEYVAIIDASIEIGKEQLLLLLGVKAELAARLDRPLAMADVVVLSMEVQSSWLAGEVKDFVDRSLARRCGLKLIYAICDQGTNLRAALRSLAVPNISDCSHVMMNLVKKIFKNDVELRTLCASVGQLRRRLTLTDYAFALPATLRDKDRFSHIFTLIEWMDRIDSYRNRLPAGLVLLLDEGRKRWLDVRLRQVHHLLVLTSNILKYDGLSLSAYDKWIQQIIDYLGSQSQVTQQAKTFINGMNDYFNRQATLYKVSNCTNRSTG